MNEQSQLRGNSQQESRVIEQLQVNAWHIRDLFLCKFSTVESRNKVSVGAPMLIGVIKAERKGSVRFGFVLCFSYEWIRIRYHIYKGHVIGSTFKAPTSGGQHLIYKLNDKKLVEFWKTAWFHPDQSINYASRLNEIRERLPCSVHIFIVTL